MPTDLQNYSFGTEWTDFYIDTYEGYRPKMSDYHMHSYYEVSLILSGSVKVLLSDKVQQGTQSRLVLTRPMTPHLVTCEPHMLYKRINLCFSGECFSDLPHEWQQLLNVFGNKGRVLVLSEEQTCFFEEMCQNIKNDTDLLRRRLRLLLLLSKAAELAHDDAESIENLPVYIINALAYLQEHYAEKITASELAWDLGIGRTTLMISFKRFTGSTLSDYLTGLRLKHALILLRQGATEHVAATECGFGDACNLIRCFRRRFDVTPMQYINNENVGNRASNDEPM